VILAMGAKVTAGTTIGVPTGARRVRSHTGGVITSGRRGLSCNSPASISSKPRSGSTSENMLAGACHERSGLTAICAVPHRQTNPSNRIRRNISKSRHPRSLSRSPSRLFRGSLAAICILSRSLLRHLRPYPTPPDHPAMLGEQYGTYCQPPTHW